MGLGGTGLMASQLLSPGTIGSEQWWRDEYDAATGQTHSVLEVGLDVGDGSSGASSGAFSGASDGASDGDGELYGPSDSALAQDSIAPIEEIRIEGGSSYDTRTGRERTSDGKLIQHEDPVTAQEMGQMQIRSSKSRLVVPSVGIDAKLLSMRTYTSGGRQIIKPPTSDNPYLVRDWTDPARAAEGMVVVAMHSIRGYPKLPGSRLIDISTGTARVKVGAEVLVDVHRYRITATDIVAKADAAGQAEVWREAPGKLLMVTCLQRSSGSSTSNVLITAQLV